MPFDSVPVAPTDAILGIAEAFQNDPRPHKINLSVGVYKDANGVTPILRSVKEAEARILRSETTKNYLSIQGTLEYSRCVQALVLGPENGAGEPGRTVTVHTPGGTAALRVAADFLHKLFPRTTVWLSEPTWPNHPSIFQAAGLAVKTYPYFDAATNGLSFERMASALAGIPAGDAVVLHACCHNPTGIDPTPQQWKQIAEVLCERRLLPLIDFAYQGLAEGIDEDAAAVAAVARRCPDVLIANSFSKNFGLYNERVGALTAVCSSAAAAQAVVSQLKSCVRANYSNPPAHGAAIVVGILTEPSLRREWEQEVAAIRGRINAMRRLFVQTLAESGVKRDFSYIARQRGMFSYSGLGPEHVERLRSQYGIYIVGSGRINVAGMTAENMRPLCAAIAAVLGE